MKKHKPLHLFNETWCCNIWYSYCTAKDYIKYLKNRHNIEVDSLGEGRYQAVYVGNEIVHLIWIRKGMKRYIPHEAIHCAVEILRGKKIDVANINGEEALCYLVDWIINKIKINK
jgi:hypothetical protein